MIKKVNILVAEDDKVISTLIKKYLSIRGFDIKVCDNGNTALRAFKKYRFDVCILDVMMPYKDGFTLAQEIRKTDKFIPIIFISSNALPKDRIMAFKIGADDYIIKPIDVEELLLRIEVVLRRQRHLPMGPDTGQLDSQEIEIGKYKFDVQYQRLELDGQVRKLTTREAELLRFLFINRNGLIKREHILHEVWGDDDYYKGRSLDVFMSRLRKYLKDDESIVILNVHGIGFKFLIGDHHSQI